MHLHSMLLKQMLTLALVALSFSPAVYDRHVSKMTTSKYDLNKLVICLGH